MEQTLFKELATQIPSLVALIILVIYFLKHIHLSQSFIRTLVDKILRVIEENTKALGKVGEAVQECKNVQKDFRHLSD